MVEGCAKSAKRYQKLMLRRIDWTADNENAQGGDDENGMDQDELAGKEPNCCDMVGQGEGSLAVVAAVVRGDNKKGMRK